MASHDVLKVRIILRYLLKISPYVLALVANTLKVGMAQRAVMTLTCDKQICEVFHRFSCCLFVYVFLLPLVVHMLKLNTWEAEAGRFLRLRLVWFLQ